MRMRTGMIAAVVSAALIAVASRALPPLVRVASAECVRKCEPSQRDAQGCCKAPPTPAPTSKPPASPAPPCKDAATCVERCQADVGAACLLLGGFFDAGVGVVQSDEKAAQYYKRACDLKEPHGCEQYAQVQARIAARDAKKEPSLGEVCARAGARLVACGFESEASWLGGCLSAPAYGACLRAAGEDCQALARCGFASFAATSCASGGVPSGGADCRATLACQNACGVDTGCVCRCNGAMSAARALEVGIQNQCYRLQCGACGASGSGACNACFSRSCGAKFASFCQGK